MHHGTNARATRSLLVLAAAYTLLVVASVAALILLRHPATLRDVAALNPFDSAESSRQFFSSAPEGTRLSGFLCFASAIPLVIYTAIAVANLQCLGVRHAGVYAALAGGVAAS